MIPVSLCSHSGHHWPWDWVQMNLCVLCVVLKTLQNPVSSLPMSPPWAPCAHILAFTRTCIVYKHTHTHTQSSFSSWPSCFCLPNPYSFFRFHLRVHFPWEALGHFHDSILFLPKHSNCASCPLSCLWTGNSKKAEANVSCVLSTVY